MARPRRVLLVCLGNICRSPTAEAVLRAKLAAQGLGERIELDSAGTYDGHVGAPPDARSQAHALKRGYDLSGLRARQVQADDFERFDLILAMDTDNLAALRRLQARVGGDSAARLTLLLREAGLRTLDVPDPYDAQAAGFETVLDLVESACEALATAWKAAPPPTSGSA